MEICYITLQADLDLYHRIMSGVPYQFVQVSSETTADQSIHLDLHTNLHHLTN
jgi:hypothetical protein